MTSLEKTFKKLQSIHLSSEARTHMRAELSAYVDLHSISPSAVKASSSLLVSFFSHRAWTVLAAFVLVVVAAGGTAFASTDALPGDPLYPVKINIADPIQTALIPSTKGKAAWHAVLAERRLEEATDLAAKDALSPGVQSELAINFDREVEASVKGADHLQRTGDASGSLDVRSDLEARITAHESILGAIVNHLSEEGTTTPSNDTSEHEARSFLAFVHDRQDSVENARLALQDRLAPPTATVSATSTAKVVALAQPSRGNRIRASFNAAATAHVEHADEARTAEIQTILAKHAGLLAAFAPIATTTTATSTQATSTAEVDMHHATTTEEKIR